MNTHYDVVICGGGFVGHALLLAGTKLGLSLCLVDAKAPVHAASNDGRAIALSYSSIELLKKLNVWENIFPQATAIERVKVSAKGRLGTMIFDAKDLDIECLGQVIPAPILGAALNRGVRSYSPFGKGGAEYSEAGDLLNSRINAGGAGGCFSVDTIISLQSHPTHATITLKNTTLTASLVLACDGTQSFCRDYLNMDTEEKPANKKAIVTNIYIDTPHQHTAYQRLIPHGVCALLPLSDNKMTVVLSLNTFQAEKINLLSDELLSQQLKEIWGGRFGNMRVIGPRFTYPLTQVYVKNPVHQRIILMGNAAHTINPIAAQGLNLAFRDIAKLYDILEDAKCLSKDLGEYVPNEYLKHAQSAHSTMDRMTDLLNNAVDATFLSPFQGIGLSLLQHMPFIKNKWTAAFTGYQNQ